MELKFRKIPVPPQAETDWVMVAVAVFDLVGVAVLIALFALIAKGAGA